MKFKEFNEEYNHKCTAERLYVKPKEECVRQSLESFKDRKFGLMMHWGLYSQLGIIESWALPDADRAWAWSDMEKYKDMSCQEFRRMYQNLQTTFNPTEMRPSEWAKIAKNAGFKYFLFTTKHHDGFCMWDTKYTDFKITSPKCPFSTNPNADICKALFDAFRAEDIPIHAYFSKPDWHSEYYWTNGYDTSEKLTRMTNYSTLFKHKTWQKFVDYTRAQMLELVQNYGRIECLWLDGGQVCSAKGMNLRLSSIMEDVRKVQPWIMVADRTIGGKNENFLTPEQTVPDKPMLVPWESCITFGQTFSYTENDIYKSAREIIHLLCNIIAKGGNLALNLAPDGSGNLPKAALDILAEIGEWLNDNGYAVYGTRPAYPYKDAKCAYTKKDNSTYAIYLADSGECIKNVALCANKTITSVKHDGKNVPFVQNGNQITVILEKTITDKIAVVFELC